MRFLQFGAIGNGGKMSLGDIKPLSCDERLGLLRELLVCRFIASQSHMIADDCSGQVSSLFSQV